MAPLPAHERLGAGRAAAGAHGDAMGYVCRVRPIASALRAKAAVGQQSIARRGKNASSPPQRAGTRATQAASPAVTSAARPNTAP